MTYNEKCVIINSNRQVGSTYSIIIDMTDKEQDVASNHETTDSEDQKW